jgi:hypothetical protein
MFHCTTPLTIFFLAVFLVSLFLLFYMSFFPVHFFFPRFIIEMVATFLYDLFSSRFSDMLWSTFLILVLEPAILLTSPLSIFTVGVVPDYSDACLLVFAPGDQLCVISGQNRSGLRPAVT